MRKHSVEIKIIVLMAFAVIAVLAAGYLAFNSINFVLTTIKKEAQPNYSLLILKEINSNLQKGESQVEYYTLTGDVKYLKSYNDVIETVENRIDSLDFHSAGSPKRQAQIDTISYLLDQKFRIWTVMLSQRNDGRLDDALSELSSVLEIAPDTVTLQVPKSVTVEVTDTSPALREDKAVEEKDGFFARLFKKKEEEPVLENQEPVEDSVMVEEVIEARDTSITLGVDKELIQSEIVRLREAEDEKLKQLTRYEVSLRQRNNQISNQLAELISRIEKEELDSLKQKATEANKLVGFTNRWSMIFLLMFCNLLIGVLYVIQRYIRKSNATQKALTTAKNEALKLSQAKEQFLANMSHEIRTPMNAIVGFTEQILEMPIEGQSREQLLIVKKSADHLLNIINDILDFSKLEAGKVKLDIHSFDVQELFYQAYQLYKPSADLKNIKLKIDYPEVAPRYLKGDSFRLRQIVFNLLSNAIKFTEKGEVVVNSHVRKLNKTSIALKIEVKDSGIGIPKEKLKSIFEEFTQADITTTRNYGGTGLGLAIVRKLVNLQKGNITVKNNEAGGACFEVEIKYQIGDAANVIKPEASKEIFPELLKKHRIIAADDDEYNRKLIKHILDKWKVDYMLVSNGGDVLTEFDKQEYHILLLDIHMPGMNGFDVSKKIRGLKDNNKNKLPIIALTAATSKEEYKQCTNAGINEILSKPYSEKDLFYKLCNTLKIKLPENKKKIVIQPSKTHAEKKAKSIMEFGDLYQLANNDMGFVKEMLQMFITNTNKDLKDLKKAYKDKDWDNVAEYAHKIKAPCKHLNAVELSKLLKDLELTARNGKNKTKIDELYTKSLEDVDLLFDKVQKHLDKNFSK